MPLAWESPCLQCGLHVEESEQSPEFRLPMHNECVAEYREEESQCRREAAKESERGQHP